MQKLYLDCDGVILDTITKSYQMLEEQGISEEEKVREFYQNLEWNSFILLSGEIDNSISKIKELVATKKYDISVLTHVISEGEASAKIKYFGEVLPGVEVITVDKKFKKADVVDATGAILVDDYLENLDYWNEMGGISVKFSDSGKPCNYKTISDLLELKEINKVEV